MNKPAAVLCLAALLSIFAVAAVFSDTPSPEPAVNLPEGLSLPKSAEEAVSLASGLAESGKWKSAFDLLAAYDPDNQDPLVLAEQIHLCLDGFVQSVMHRMFSLADLKEGETLEGLRGANAEYEVFSFDPPALAAAQAEAGTASVPTLDRALGDYYYQVRAHYESQWILPEEEVLSLGSEAYERGRQGGAFDAESLGNEAELLLRLGQPEKAESLLQSAEELEPSPQLAYNHAVALLMLERPEEALPMLDTAIAGYKEASLRYDAYTLAARTASSMGDAARAEAYLAQAEAENPGEPGPGLFRHYLALSRGDLPAAAAAADALFARFPTSPYVIRTLVGSWLGSGAVDEAVAFLDRSLAATSGNDESAGALDFYKALLLLQSAKDEAGLDSVLAVLDEAEGHFKAVYPPEHEVFGVIEEIRGEVASQRAAMTAPAASEQGVPGADAAPVTAPEQDAGQASDAATGTNQ